MKRILFSIITVSLLFTSCSEDNDEVSNTIITPKTYAFTRDGKSTVEFSKAKVQFQMALELVDNLGANGLTNTQETLNNMLAKGKGFKQTSLNTSGEVLKKVVASAENSILSDIQKSAYKAKVDAVLKNFVVEIIPAKDVDASKGVAGKLTSTDENGTKNRYINKRGLEADQTISKMLFGGLFLDQIANQYLSDKYLQSVQADNSSKVLVKNTNYTELEHAWDMAYGYIFSLEEEPKNPINSTNFRFGFLNSYLKSVESDEDFRGIFDNINNAFKTGRQAITENKYDIMNAQAKIIREELSKVMAVRTVHYLWKGLGTKQGKQVHALSEVYGFFYALWFAHNNGQQLGEDYTKAYISEFEGENGVWDVSEEKIIEIADKISKDFGFTKEQAK